MKNSSFYFIYLLIHSFIHSFMGFKYWNEIYMITQKQNKIGMIFLIYYVKLRTNRLFFFLLVSIINILYHSYKYISRAIVEIKNIN